MKTKMIRQVTAVLIAFALSVSPKVAAECEQHYANGVCTYTPAASSGGCSGVPTGNPPACQGTKTLTEYNDCRFCATSSESNCQSLGCPESCTKRTTVIPCINLNGYCVEGPANAPGQWIPTDEIFCHPG